MTRTDDMDWVPVRRAYKFRAYPTRCRQGRAVRLLADHCDLYDAALTERREVLQRPHRAGRPGDDEHVALAQVGQRLVELGAPSIVVPYCA